MSNTMSWFAREATTDDMATIQDIYSYYVVNTTTTFEYEVPTVREMEERFNDIKKKLFPYIVVVDSITEEVYGYAYATTYKVRAAYNNTVENSIYLRHGLYRRGLGTFLLQKLIGRCTMLGLRQMIAVISHGGDTFAGSVALHKKFGFKHKGTLTGVGYKFGSWIDSSLYQLTMGEGSDAQPTFVLGT